MTGNRTVQEGNEAKADLAEIYDQRDPRAYFGTLKAFRYAIPGQAKPVFNNLISHLRREREDTVHVLDLGCSYGVNAALLKHDLSMSDLYEHWGGERMNDASSDEVIARDRCFFADLDASQDIQVYGLDQADNAVEFAEEVGLLDKGFAVNLENGPLPASAQADLGQVDLVTSTGCVGYVTEKSFARLLPAVTQGRAPWFANFVLRMFPFDAIHETLSNRDYVTEKLEGHTFVQRQFTSVEEREQVLDHLCGLGIDPSGKESEGHLLAEFYLSRPADEAARAPVARLVPQI